jgi:hypothetical protein
MTFEAVLAAHAEERAKESVAAPHNVRTVVLSTMAASFDHEV